VARPARHIPPKEDDFSIRRRKNPGNQVEERGLAGAVWADDGFSFSGKNLQRDLAHRGEAAEAFRQRA
jgi:hypothetical protein